jgi:Bacterial regulatory helix-turn-helix protein, lysR family
LTPATPATPAENAQNDPTRQWLNRLRLRQVALVVAIDERRTLRAAAAELGMTQPAATKTPWASRCLSASGAAWC